MATNLRVALLITSILVLSLLPLSSSRSSSSATTATLLRAADILSNSGFLSMSLTLQLVSKTLIPHPHSRKYSHSHFPLSLTIFSPTDAAFASSGQPSLSLLQLHFSPLFLTIHSIKILPRNTKIPTLHTHHSLIITSSPSDQDWNVSINGVKIHPSPLYDDGSLIIFGIDEFFDPGYRVSGSTKISQNVNLACGMSFNGSVNAFEDVSEVLRSKGYSFMAAFLELQLLRFNNKSSLLTVFAPTDDVMMDYAGNVSEYSSLLLRHVVSCKILWSDLVRLDDGGVVLGTFLEGFKINVTRSDNGVLMLNGVELSSPDVYYSEWLVVHGIREILELPKREEKVAAEPASSENGSDDSEQNDAPDHGEF